MKANSIRAVALGVLTILVLSLAMSALAAALVGRGILPTGSMPAASWIITAVAAFLGAVLCGNRAKTARLPLCLAMGVVYLMIIFILRGLIFRTMGTNLWAVPLCTLSAAAVGAALTSRKKRRR